MARTKGKAMYGRKDGGRGVLGSFYITKAAHRKLMAAARRSGQSASTVIDYCLRQSADTLTRTVVEAEAASASP